MKPAGYYRRRTIVRWTFAMIVGSLFWLAVFAAGGVLGGGMPESPYIDTTCAATYERPLPAESVSCPGYEQDRDERDQTARWAADNGVPNDPNDYPAR